MLFCNKENQFIMCSDCGDFIKHKYAFYATYKHGGIVLCKDCAKKLYENLKDFLNKESD
jgi:hypothetical protein